MAYRFNGSTSQMVFDIAPFTGYTFGAITVAGYLKQITAQTNPIVGILGKWSAKVDTTQTLLMTGNTSGPFASVSTTVWYLAVVTWAGGAAVPRFHLYDGTSWQHGDTAGNNAANVATITGAETFQVGAYGVNSNFDLVATGVKKGSSTDLAVETLSPTAFSSWVSFGFDHLIGYTGAASLVNQGTGTGGNEVSRVATTLVSDPVGWSFATSGGGGGGGGPRAVERRKLPSGKARASLAQGTSSSGMAEANTTAGSPGGNLGTGANADIYTPGIEAV